MRGRNLLALLVLLAAACSRDALPADADGGVAVTPMDQAVAPDAACGGALSGYCFRAPCPTWADAMKEAHAVAASGDCFFAELGRCGGGFYYRAGNGLGGKLLYFNGAGELTAIELSSDTNEYCGRTSFSVTWGTITDCAFQPTETLCVGGHTDLGARD